MTCFTCGHRLQFSYKSVVAMTLLTTSNPINLYRYRTELNWYQFVISSLQSPASTTSVPNFLSRLRSESRVKHNQAAYQNIQIRVSDCQIVTLMFSQQDQQPVSVHCAADWLPNWTFQNHPKLYKHIILLTSEKIVLSYFQVPHGCMFFKIRQMMVSNCKWFNHALPFHFQ